MPLWRTVKYEDIYLKAYVSAGQQRHQMLEFGLKAVHDLWRVAAIHRGGCDRSPRKLDAQRPAKNNELQRPAHALANCGRLSTLQHNFALRRRTRTQVGVRAA